MLPTATNDAERVPAATTAAEAPVASPTPAETALVAPQQELDLGEAIARSDVSLSFKRDGEPLTWSAFGMLMGEPFTDQNPRWLRASLISRPFEGEQTDVLEITFFILSDETEGAIYEIAGRSKRRIDKDQGISQEVDIRYRSGPEDSQTVYVMQQGTLQVTIVERTPLEVVVEGTLSGSFTNERDPTDYFEIEDGVFKAALMRPPR